MLANHYVASFGTVIVRGEALSCRTICSLYFDMKAFSKS